MKYLIALSVPILWGTSYAIIGSYLLDIPSAWLAVWRALPAGLLLLLLSPKLFSLKIKDMLFISVGNIALFFPLLMTAIYLLPGSVAGTLGATFPLIMMFFNFMIYRIKPTIKLLSCSLVGLAGVILLLNPEGDINIWGVVAAFLAISIMSITSLWMRRLTIEDVLNVAAWQLTLGGFLMLPFAIMSAGSLTMPVQAAWPGLLWLIIANTAYGYWAWIKSLNSLGTELMGIFSLLNPLVAVVLGVYLMHEHLDRLQLAGIFLIFTALLASTPIAKHIQWPIKKKCSSAKH